MSTMLRCNIGRALSPGKCYVIAQEVEPNVSSYALPSVLCIVLFAYLKRMTWSRQKTCISLRDGHDVHTRIDHRVLKRVAHNVVTQPIREAPHAGSAAKSVLSEYLNHQYVACARRGSTVKIDDSKPTKTGSIPSSPKSIITDSFAQSSQPNHRAPSSLRPTRHSQEIYEAQEQSYLKIFEQMTGASPGSFRSPSTEGERSPSFKQSVHAAETALLALSLTASPLITAASSDAKPPEVFMPSSVESPESSFGKHTPAREWQRVLTDSEIEANKAVLDRMGMLRV